MSTQKDYVNAGMKIKQPNLLDTKHRYIFPSYVKLKEDEMAHGIHYCHTFTELTEMFPTIESMTANNPTYIPADSTTQVLLSTKRTRGKKMVAGMYIYFKFF